MSRAVIYLFVGTVLSFLLNHYILESKGWDIDWYYGFAFGVGWGLAYFVDRIEWSLLKKMGISVLGILLLVILGLVFFDMTIAVPSVIKFSTIFVAYYLLASFKGSKSLRK